MRVLAIVLAALMLGGCDFEGFIDTDRYKEDFHHTYPLKAGGRLSVDNFNGSVEITGWDQNQVEINGTKYAATRELLDSLKIDIKAAADSVEVRTTRPGERRGNCGARYTIRVPRSVQLTPVTSTNGSLRVEDTTGPATLRTSNGSIRTLRLKGTLEAQTTNGRVEMTDVAGNATARTSNGTIKADGLKGALEASTTNGSINASLSEMPPERLIRVSTTNGRIELSLDSPPRADVRATTTNGGITLRLPSKTNARVDASTTNSTVSTDFDVLMSGKISKREIRGQIGAGGPHIDLNTTNGGITIQKSL